jgi:glucose-6-phosphate dehydrogenase assembly protein OpcA
VTGEREAEDRETDAPAMRPAGEAPPGRWTRTVDPEHIDAELSALWREVSHAGGPRARALMSNLIVYADDEGGDQRDAEAEMSEVSRLHPSRVLLVRHDPSASPKAEVTIQTHGQGVSQFGVEHVAIEAPDREAIPSLLRRLTIGDLPTSICWTAPDVPKPRVVQHLAPLGRQFVFDSSVWADPVDAIRAIAPLGTQAGVQLDIGDLTWRRLKPLRAAIVQAVDPTVLRRDVGHVRSITIEAGDGQRAMAWLLAAWIGSRLRWTAVQRTGTSAESAVTFDSPHGRPVVKIAPGAEEGLRAIIETDALPDSPALDASHRGEHVEVRYGWDVPPLTMMVPNRSRSEMLAAELRNLYVDTLLRDALALVARIHAL